MVAAGLLGITIADDYIAQAWAGVLKDLQLHADVVVRTRGDIAWAFRKDSPQLAAELMPAARVRHVAIVIVERSQQEDVALLQSGEFVKVLLANLGHASAV